MTYDRDRLRAALIQAVERIEPNLFITLVFNRDVQLGPAARAVEEFCKRLERRAHGKRWLDYPAAERLKALAFPEHIDSNLHFHLAGHAASDTPPAHPAPPPDSLAARHRLPGRTRQPCRAAYGASDVRRRPETAAPTEGSGEPHTGARCLGFPLQPATVCPASAGTVRSRSLPDPCSDEMHPVGRGCFARYGSRVGRSLSSHGQANAQSQSGDPLDSADHPSSMGQLPEP